MHKCVVMGFSVSIKWRTNNYDNIEISGKIQFAYYDCVMYAPIYIKLYFRTHREQNENKNRKRTIHIFFGHPSNGSNGKT